MSEFTPGPWRITYGSAKGRPDGIFAYNEGQKYGGRGSILNIQYKGVEVDDCWLGVTEADAYLIAAAPDMYEALERLLVNMTAIAKPKFDDPSRFDELSSVIKARKTLAKAKGPARKAIKGEG